MGSAADAVQRARAYGRGSKGRGREGGARCRGTWWSERSLTDYGSRPKATEPHSVLAVVERNADEGVTWVHSYVSEDREKTFCVCDAPNPEAIRKTAGRNNLPVDRITQVRVLDPYFYG